MADNSKNWKAAEYGKAQSAFEQVRNKALTPKPPPPVLRATEMDKRTKPALVLKPPGVANRSMAQTSIEEKRTETVQQAAIEKPKIQVSLHDQKEIDKLNTRFRQAAKNEREQDKSR
jgi:hypothetical protein